MGSGAGEAGGVSWRQTCLQTARDHRTRRRREETAPRPPTPVVHGTTRVEQIEAKIVEAEDVLHTAQKEMDDPKVLADRNKLDAVCRRVESAQVAVQKLYARWEELETKQKD